MACFGLDGMQVTAACLVCSVSFTKGPKLGNKAEPITMCCAGKPPLYFQHEGHSRTIIGIERYKPTEGKAKRRAESSATCSNEGYLYNLLVLDPSHKTKDLVAAFRTGKGWQVCLPILLTPLS